MSDLLQPDEVLGIRGQYVACTSFQARWGPERPRLLDHLPRLCRDYLVLWERVEELEVVINRLKPYPSCHTPEQCAGVGYCNRDPACND